MSKVSYAFAVPTTSWITSMTAGIPSRWTQGAPRIVNPWVSEFIVRIPIWTDASGLMIPSRSQTKGADARPAVR